MTSNRVTLSPYGQEPLFDLRPSGVGEFDRLSSHEREAPRPCRDRLDASNLRLLQDLTIVGHWGIPRIRPTHEIPSKLVSFSEAMTSGTCHHEAWVHFFEDDYRFERIWNRPETYIPRLGAFAGVISPDFSICRNMPEAMKVYNTYRNQLLGARMQTDGLKVIANVRLSGLQSAPYALAGVPTESTIALGLHGCTRDRQNRRHVREEVRIICDDRQPSALIVYGGAGFGVLNYPRELGIPVHLFPPDTLSRSRMRRAAA